jgi:hypothetical protein
MPQGLASGSRKGWVLYPALAGAAHEPRNEDKLATLSPPCGSSRRDIVLLAFLVKDYYLTFSV